MDVRAHVSMVFHLDKCIGCHTCSIACKNTWTDRPGAEYMWWNNVETKPGTGYPTLWEDQSEYKGGWELDGKGGLRLRSQSRASALDQALLQPGPARPRRLLRALDLPLPGPVRRRGGGRPADRGAHLPGHRRADRHRGRPELGRRPLRLAGLCRERPEPGGHRPLRRPDRGRAADALRRREASP